MARYAETLPRFAHTSHRGGSLVAPENTLVAFRQSVQAWRTHVLELDVQPSRDGQVVVIHDDRVDRTTNGQGKVADHTLEQLRQLDAGWHLPAYRGTGVTIPTLQEVLTEFPDMHINIELKDGTDAFLALFAAEIGRHGAEERVCIGHVQEERSTALRALLPRCAFWFPQEAAARAVMASKAGMGIPPQEPWEVLSLPLVFHGMEVIDAALVRDAHARGKPVHVWTVDEETTMERLMDFGVDSIITDRPDLLRSVMDRRGLPS